MTTVAAEAETISAPQGMKTFFIIWIGQLISMLGSGLTSFALAVWIFDQTGRSRMRGRFPNNTVNAKGVALPVWS